ncbi:MAG: hypothetical protein ABH818_01415 [Patescibacteria group bacterium]
MNEKIKTKNYILIIIFAIIFNFVVNNGIRIVIQEFMGLDPFVRMLSAFLTMAISTFIIGTFLKNKAKFSGVVATLPSVFFWIAILIFHTTIMSKFEFEFIYTMLLPFISIIFLPVIGYFSSGFGQQFYDHFQKSKSILNIKWYHWLWIIPFYLKKMVAVLLFCVTLLVTAIFSDEWTGIRPSISDLATHWRHHLAKIALFFIVFGLFYSVVHLYSLLTEENATIKCKWKKWIIIFGYVLLFSILYIFLFGQYL